MFRDLRLDVIACALLFLFAFEKIFIIPVNISKCSQYFWKIIMENCEVK